MSQQMYKLSPLTSLLELQQGAMRPSQRWGCTSYSFVIKQPGKAHPDIKDNKSICHLAIWKWVGKS